MGYSANLGPKYNLLNKSYFTKARDVSPSSKQIYLIDAKDSILGRLSNLSARVMCGKTTPKFSYSHDSGDYVIIVNSDKVKVTGKKYWKKNTFRSTHSKRSGSGRIGGCKNESFNNLLARRPELPIKLS